MTDKDLSYYRWVVQTIDIDMIEGDYRIQDDSTALHPDDEEDDYVIDFVIIVEGEEDDEEEKSNPEQEEDENDPDHQ
ncbi:unnamed protein product [Rotaria sp. Silwood1]|nr:unnamed protein product [Rotaria sp. Silwood1]